LDDPKDDNLMERIDAAKRAYVRVVTRLRPTI
jgi:hypothetical protein